MVVFAQTKAGKTQALSGLQNALIIDTENGSNFVDGHIINIKKECDKQGINPMLAIEQIAEQLQAYYKENGKYPYDYVIVDTMTEIEEFARAFATFLYKQLPIGKSFAGTDVVSELPNGGGYGFLRDAFDRLLSPLKGKYNKALILSGHVKSASINKQGKDLNARDVALTGKLKMIVCAEADAIGYMYRNPKNNNQTILSFVNHEQDLATGARPTHLANQEFVICELTNPDYAQKKEDRIFKTFWEQIFIN